MSQTVTIEPEQAVVVTVKADLRNGNQLIEFSPVTDGVLCHPLLIIEEVTVETGESGFFQIEITNRSTERVELPAGSVLGTTVHYEGVAAAVSFIDPTESLPTDGENAPSTSHNQCRGRWPSREAFLGNFDLTHREANVRRELESLFCDYGAIFASHEFDLGKAQIATHTIKLQLNSSPVYCRPFRSSEFE